MTRTSEQVDAAALLLRQDGWTRRLARSLVSDDALADDIAQDTWVSALRRPPETRAPLRPWLRKVVRHNLFNQSRLGRRREARERATGLPLDPPSPEELVGRGEIHRLLVEAVLALKEPYRQVVVLRYFDGLTSAQIAARTNVPPATARGRLKTALDLLREALDARRDDQRDWFEAVGDLFDATADAPDIPTAAPSSPGGAWPSPPVKAGGPRPPAPASSKPPAQRLLAGRALPVKAVVLTIVLGAAAIPVAPRIASWNRRAVRADRTTEAAGVPDEATLPGGGEAEEAEVTGGTPHRGRPPVAVVARAGATSEGVSGSREVSASARPVTAERARVASFQGIAGRVRSSWQVLGARADAAGGYPDRGGGLANVVVKIVAGLGAAPAVTPPPTNLALVRLGPAGFAPHVLVARVGETVAVENDDVVPHDLEVLQDSMVLFKGSVPAASPADVPAASPAQPVAVTVAAAGAVIKLSVVTRPQLLAFVVTADNPFHTITDAQGRFFLAGVPPGAYVVEAWHEFADPTRTPVQVSPAGTGEVELVLNGPPSRVPPGACRIAGHRSTPISEACRTGGLPAAKKAMKRLVSEGRQRGGAFTCEGCHVDLDSYRLVKEAETKLSELLRLIGA